MDELYLLTSELSKIPNESGVYRFFNEKKEIIYIGKAKNLNSRIKSYFKTTTQSIKTTNLVKNIKYISFTIVNNEHEAFLLENNLIKKLQPRYNILLKDNKTYPYIIITSDEIPKIAISENLPTSYKYIFGPFSNRLLMHSLIEFIVKICKIRICKYDLTKTNIENNKYKVCLEYHIENCCGICEKRINFKQYDELVDKAINILKGNFKVIKSEIKKKMLFHSKNEQYKLAQKYKNELESLNTYESKSIIANPKLKDLDVIYIEKNNKEIYSSYMIIKGGILIFTKSDIFYNINETDIMDLYKDEYKSTSKTIISNIQFKYKDITTTIPKIGDKKKLLEICQQNINYFKNEIKIKKTLEINTSELLINLKNELNLKTIPFEINCFDNSNLQGTNPVSSCVVFKNGAPSKEDYRKFNVKTVSGADDFKTMEEVIYRMYKNRKSLPNLIVIDGGEGQLNSAVKILKQLNIFGKVDVIGLAKEFEEIYFYKKSKPVILDKNSQTLHLIQHIRDEAHRFAITFHRKKREQNFIK